MKKGWNRWLSGVLAFMMVLTSVLVAPNWGSIEAEAAGNSEFTLYYYYEGSESLYMDIWNHAGIDFADSAQTSTDWGWTYSQAILQAVDGQTNWYSVPLKIVAEENDGFDVYAGSGDNNVAKYDNQWNNVTDYAILVSGEKDAYAIKDGALVDPAEYGLTGSSSDVVKGAEIGIEKVSNLSDDFCMGMDISSAISLFDSGVKFKDEEGNEIDNLDAFCALLKNNGVTDIRVRVWNDPYKDAEKTQGYGGGNNDVAKAKLFADACRKAGLHMLVDFHCSDFWADPGKYKAPKEWAGYTLEEKESAVETFIGESLNTIDPTKDVVTMVQVGNETTGGFVGETSVTNMCKLFSAGAKAVRAYKEGVKVVIHITNPEKGRMTTWAKNLQTNEVDYDVLATSYYPYWHGSLDNLKSEMTTVKNTYGKETMVAETSYANTMTDFDGHENTIRSGNEVNENCTEPYTVQGQATAIRNLIAAVNSVGGIGVFYWEPAWISVGDVSKLTGNAYDERVAANKVLWEQYGSGWASSYSKDYDLDAAKYYGGSAVDNQAMFAQDGTPLASLRVWSYVRTGAESKYTSVDEIQNPTEAIDFGGTYTLPETVKVSYNNGNANDPVVWDEEDKGKINVNIPGTYVVKGTVTFSKTVNDGEYNGKTTADVTYNLTVNRENILPDPGFEESESKWTIEGSGYKLNHEDKRSGAKCLHFWASSDFAFTATQKITLKPGVYSFGGYLYGGSAGENDVYQLFVSVGDKTNTKNMSLGSWICGEVSEFTVGEETEVTVGVKQTSSGGAWGSWDDLYIYQIAEAENVNPCADGHTLTKVEAKAATTTAAGNKEYWICEECGKIFADAEGKTETTLAAVTIPKLSSGNSTDGNSTSGTKTDTTTTKTPAKKGVVLTKSNLKYKVTKSATKNGTVTCTGATSKLSGAVKIPATITDNGFTFKVTAVADNAFKNNKKITSATVGKNVTTIGKNAFAGAAKLKKVTLGSAVKTIGASAFKNCKVLSSLTIPAKVTAIGASAFSGAKKLTTLTVKSAKLTKKGVKNALKGSSVTKVKLSGSSAKKNKAAYKKYFAKGNSGKSVKVK